MELSNGAVTITTRETDGCVRHEIGAAGVVVAASLDDCWTAVHGSGRTLTFEGRTAHGPATLVLTMPATGPWVHCRFEATVSGPVCAMLARYEFRPGPAQFAFAPHIRPADDHTIAQWGMKTPAAIVQSGRETFALVLDTDLAGAQSRTLPLAIDMEADPLVRQKPLLGIGFQWAEPVDLNYFRTLKSGALTLAGEPVRFGYYLWVGTDHAPGAGYRDVARFVWEVMGSRRIGQTVAPQVAGFAHYARIGLAYGFAELWKEFEVSTGPGGAFLNGICYPNDVWFQSLFNHLRSAIGVWAFGHPEQANRIKNLALSAPMLAAGPFKTIFHSAIRQARRDDAWVTSSHWMLSSGVESKMRSVRRNNLVKTVDWENLYHTVDCSWTAYWMLRWHRDVEADQRLVQFAVRYAAFLLREQRASGAIPSFFRGEALAAEPLLAENVGTAASGALLALLHELTGERKYFDAAARAARFIEREVLVRRVWQDYEVIFDSGAKPLGFFDRHTQQYAQVTQGMVWSAAMFGTLARTTGQPFLERAGEVVDYLALFQQVWDPPFLSVKTFGGFPVGNSHPSWNDARTPLLATAFADHYDLTREPQYLQRAVAAVRASLVLMFMPENKPVSGIYEQGPRGHADEGYAGRGRDEQFTGLSFDFPVGAALSSIALMKQRYGDVYVDASREFAIGIDGWLVHAVRANESAIDLTMKYAFADERPAPARIVIERATTPAALTVNGRMLGTFDAAQLLAGVTFLRGRADA